MTDLAPTPTAPPAAPDLGDLVRRALLETADRLRAACAVVAADDRRRHQALDRWYGGFAGEVRGHFELVEVAVLPALTRAGALDDRALDTVAGDHAWADHLVGELGDALGILAFGLGEAEMWFARTAALADELHVVLSGVLAREARVLAPLVAEHLSATARRELDRELLRDITVQRAPFSLAWLCELLDEREQAFVLGAASSSSRLVYRSRRRGYRRSTAAAFAPDR
jgi:hypothetical protein